MMILQSCSFEHEMCFLQNDNALNASCGTHSLSFSCCGFRFAVCTSILKTWGKIFNKVLEYTWR